MTMITVDDLARDLKVKNEDLLRELITMGYKVDSPESPLETDDPAGLRAKLVTSLPQREVVEKRIKPTVIRRRVKPNAELQSGESVSESLETADVETHGSSQEFEGDRSAESSQRKQLKKTRKPEAARIIEMAPKPAVRNERPAISKPEPKLESPSQPTESAKARFTTEPIEEMESKQQVTEAEFIPLDDSRNAEEGSIVAAEESDQGEASGEETVPQRPEQHTGPRPLDDRRLLEDRSGKKKKKKEKRMQPAQIIGKVELRKEPPPQERPPERPAERQPERFRDAARPERPDRPDRPVRFERPGGPRPERPAGTDRPDRPQRPGAPRFERTPSRTDRPFTQDKGDRPDQQRPGAPHGPARPRVVHDIQSRIRDLQANIMPDVFSTDDQKRKKKPIKKARDVVEEKVDDDKGVRRRKEVVLRNDLYEDRTRPSKLRKGKKIKKKTEITTPKASKRKIKIPEMVSVSSLAHKMSIKASEVIQHLLGLGVTATINEGIDYDTATIVAGEFGFDTEHSETSEKDLMPAAIKDTEENLVTRPPVITVMGHVDHGKTSLLDAIRSTKVTDSEAGGITQHIGAYKVKVDRGELVFLDTPGHEAFTAMRARGAQVTDFVILVVAADDGVMDQTVEAINHARAAQVPIIVAVNKIDKPEADPERVKRELSEHNLLPEQWGGDTLYAYVSAKTGEGVEEFLDLILLQAELMELKSNPDKQATGTVVEARLDKGKGPIATVLVKEGTLKLGDPFVAGTHYGKVRAMLDHAGKPVSVAGPATPVEVHGLSGVPEAGEMFVVVEDEKIARQIVEHRTEKQKMIDLASGAVPVSLEDILARMQDQQIKELNVILKGDVQGSVEALKEALLGISAEEIKVKVIHGGVGAITESDVMLASASRAIVIGFNVRPSPKATQLAEQEKIDIRLYTIIYEAIADVRKAMEGMLAPIEKEKVMGRAEVRQTFSVPKIGVIAGCHVVSGKIERSNQVRLLRDDVVVYTGRISSMKRFKDDIKEAVEGYECGLGLDNYRDIKVGDIIEAFTIEHEAVKLS